MKKKLKTKNVFNEPHFVKNVQGGITQVHVPLDMYNNMMNRVKEYEKIQKKEGVRWVQVSGQKSKKHKKAKAPKKESLMNSEGIKFVYDDDGKKVGVTITLKKFEKFMNKLEGAKKIYKIEPLYITNYDGKITHIYLGLNIYKSMLKYLSKLEQKNWLRRKKQIDWKIAPYQFKLYSNGVNFVKGTKGGIKCFIIEMKK